MQKNQKQGIAQLDGKIIIPLEYDNIIIAGNCINAEKSGNVTLFRTDETEFQNKEFVSRIPTGNDKYIICVNKEDKYGVIDNKDNKVIENKYTYINYLWDDYFIVQKDTKLGIISSDERMVVDFKYDVLQRVENSKIIEGIEENTTYLFDKDFKIIESLNVANIEEKNDYIKIYSIQDKKMIYLDYYGNIVDNKKVLKENKLFAKRENGKWGFSDEYGNIKVESKYDMVTEFNEYGFAGVMQNNKWGVINDQGIVIQEPTYKMENQIFPTFIGKYYKVNLGYGENFYKSE